jgi:hypothetical protein
MEHPVIAKNNPGAPIDIVLDDHGTFDCERKVLFSIGPLNLTHVKCYRS